MGIEGRSALARAAAHIVFIPPEGSNVVLLAKLATLMKIPVMTTASEPNGTNGPLMPEIHQFAPHAVYVPHFVKTVRATDKKTLIMAGVWTSVCVMFPALDAKAA